MTGEINDAQIGQMSKTIFRFCLSRTRSYHDAEDLAQEILLIACRKGNRFENEKAFYAFVWKTAANVLKGWIEPLAADICEKAKGRVAGIMREYAPDHLADYAARLPPIFQLTDAEGIMQILCESGWLLPVRDGMLPTTVMMKNR